MTTTKTLILVISIVIIGLAQENNQLPDQFSWADKDGVSYLGPVHNQNFPFACNSGWAFSTISMLQSRIKKRRNASSPDISLSTQVLLSCDTLNYGCLGGDPTNALRWISRNNITDETCHAYKARGYTEGEKCTSQTKCQNCNKKGSCISQQNSKIYSISLHGTVAGDEDMMQQIFTFGSIACGISVTPGLKNYTGGIFEDSTGSKGANHFVLVYGWGQENGSKFWNVRNSWGSNWGEQGNFRIVRGNNNLGIQGSCFWSSLKDTWTNDIRNHTVPTPNLQLSSKITYKLPDFLTSSKSTLTPHYCSSSWAFATVQMLRDRLNRQSGGKTQVDFSVQSLLNCGVGSCETETDPFHALTFIEKYGIPQQGCQNYKGEQPVRQNCSAVNNCAFCSGTAFKSNCSQVVGYKRWRIQKFAAISGQAEMKSQINSQGPIVCGMDKNSTVFINYEGGILKEITINPKINHYVEIVRHGSQNGTNYWIGRNFWGTAWGEEGFFRIKTGGNNLGIQKRCFHANFAK